LRPAGSVQTRLFVMMALQVGGWGAWAVKLFPYMTMQGYSAGQQALVGSSWGIASIVAIFFSNQFADRNFAAERFLAASHALGALFLIGAAYASSFAAFFGCYLVYSLLYVPTLSVTNSIAFANLPDPARQFGTVRTGGTIGWVIASWPFIFLLGAHATAEQTRWIFLVSAMISLALAGFALTLPHTAPRRSAALDPLAWRRAVTALRRPDLALLFLVTFIDSIVHNGYFVVSDAFLTDRVGIAGNLSMVVLSLGQIAEILAMLVLGRVLARMGWRKTMILGVLAHMARFLVFAFAADHVPVIIAVQFLHGICYAFFFATLYIYVDDAFPKDVAVSAQGLFNLLILGIGMMIASYVFPKLMSVLSHGLPGSAKVVVDYQTLFLFPSGLAALASMLLLLFFRPTSFGPGRKEPLGAGPELALDPGAGA